MKDKIAKTDWAIKKGPQLVQNMNDDTNKPESEKENKTETKKDDQESIGQECRWKHHKNIYKDSKQTLDFAKLKE